MITIYYNDQCKRCLYFVKALEILCILENHHYTPLKEAPPAIQDLSLKTNSWVVKIKHKEYTKGEAFLRLLSKTKPWWPILKILCMWPIRWITFPMANFCYRRLQPKSC